LSYCIMLECSTEQAASAACDAAAWRNWHRIVLTLGIRFQLARVVIASVKQ